jgi:hypothetical protein
MTPSTPVKPQKVKLDKDVDGYWQVYALYRFYGWSWMADARSYKLARKVAALVRRGA